MRLKNAILFIIDPQVDFCDPNGKLYVKGAEKDISRLSNMIEKNMNEIDDIFVTLDSHHTIHIAHPIFWVNQKGEHPNPFTLITAEDVKKGIWRAYNPGYQARAETYVNTLEKNGRYVLCIWPPHCLIGSQGATIMPELFAQLERWENQFAMVNMITKGSNLFTEHYSAVKADVIDNNDNSTMLNAKLITTLQKCGPDQKIIISGEAMSHCVANTIRDTIQEFSPEEAKKFIILEDASSNVTGFEYMGNDFLKEMVSKGVQISTTDKVFK